MSQPLLVVRDLSVSFKQDERAEKALTSVSFSLERGETMAIVGESGSGKSVTALSIMGLLPGSAIVHSGSIQFHEKREQVINLLETQASAWSAIRGAQIGMIFQEPMSSLNPLMRCGEQVAEVIRLHKKCTEKQAVDLVKQLFHEVKLPDPESMLKRYPHEISGGQKQRVMIAMAIACDPLLLIADEPTTALDVTVQRTIVDLLKELCAKRGMSIIFITHDLNLVKDFADTVLIMYRGEVIESGKTSTVFQHPEQLYTNGLINCRPSKDVRRRFLPTVQDIMAQGMQVRDDESAISVTAFEKQLEQIRLNPALIKLQDVEIEYGSGNHLFGKRRNPFKAVNNVNLEIRQGETLGLVGESGCGKTSIGKAIAGLVKPSAGTIFYRGKDISGFSKQEWMAYHRQVQIIFQDPYSSLNPRMRIGDAIREPMDVHALHTHGERHDKVIELLEKVGLSPGHYHRYPHEFSGGQRQRICIARALALQPSFIVCDESVSALDVSVQAQVLNLLVSLKEDFKLSYLFISHNLGVVRHISDHVAVMQRGIVMEYNDAENLYRHPAHAYTRELIESDY